jgi:hypothetical protein
MADLVILSNQNNTNARTLSTFFYIRALDIYRPIIIYVH